MTMILEDVLDKYDQYDSHTRSNEFEIISSKQCGCLSCGNVFSARVVKSWLKEGQELSAFCPHCGMVKVVGDASGLPIGKTEFKELSQTYARRNDDDARRSGMMEYCASFFDGAIEDNLNNELLYERYLNAIFDDFHDAVSCLALARLYARGLRFIPKSFEMAEYHYKHEALVTESTAFHELGCLYQERGARGDYRLAYECFAKAAALGSLSASSRLACCYLDGEFVKKDVFFGLNALLSVFSEMYGKAFGDTYLLREFAWAAYRLGMCFYKGVGCKADSYRSARYLMIAGLALQRLAERGDIINEDAQNSIDSLLGSIISKSQNKGGEELLFDEDTFFDSFYENYDSVSQKTLNNVHYNDSGDTLLMEFNANQPILVVDSGNFKAGLYSDTYWAIYHAKYRAHETQTQFERIEFIGQDAVEFIHDDPVYGEVVVLHIDFEPRNPPGGDAER
ncbi:MAG: sel1 repeat family protein [Bacilli bacterium]|nr:sel1 repeat family protein [Bacilli bacterium]